MKKLSEYQIIYPYYFGWFINNDESKEIVSLAKKTFEKCIDVCVGFKNDLKTKTSIY